MICKVVSASLGYNGYIYKEGDDVEVDTQAEVERLIGYGAIEAGSTSGTLREEVPIVETPLKPLFDSKTVKGGRKRK